MHLLSDIAQASEIFAPFTGAFGEGDLHEWAARELTPELGTRFLFPENIVHIISGNTPHAAWQTLLHGLMLGVKSRLKLPSEGLADFEKKVAQLPSSLRKLIEVSRPLPAHWIEEAGALIVYGSDATIHHFRDLTPLEIPFIGHGHRIGIALIEEATPEAAELAARDICEFDQNGCLSLQTLYLEDPRAFAPLLAEALTAYQERVPRAPLTPSEHGALSNFRHEARYLQAQEPERHALWLSAHSNDWTIFLQDSPELKPSPGHRTVILKPLARFLGISARHLSGIALHPFRERSDLPSPRIFPLGKAQRPPFGWAHDGTLPLRSLVKVQTLG